MKKILFLTCDANVSDMKDLYRLAPLYSEVMKMYPRLLNIRYHFYTPKGTNPTSYSNNNRGLLINPEKSGFSYNYNSYKFHGINSEIFNKFGGNSKLILSIFKEVIDNADIIVTYNANFTLNLLISEYYKNKFDVKKIFGNKYYFCLMKGMKNICKIKVSKRSTDYKSPKLIEVAHYLFPSFPDNKIIPIKKLDCIRNCYFKLYQQLKKEPENTKVFVYPTV